MKNCPRCHHEKPLSEFYVRSSGAPSSWCKSCVKAANKVRQRQVKEAGGTWYNPAVDVWSHRFRRYGLTREAFETMEREQGGVCAICRELPGEKGFNVDHDHETGRVRGLLCGRCNRGMGQLRDNPDFLMAAITYLEHGFLPDERCS